MKSLIVSRPAALGALASALFAGAAMAADAVPDFMSNNMGWAASSADFLPPTPDMGVPGPVMYDPAYPYCRNNQGCTVTPRVGDWKNPILQKWASDAVKKVEDTIIKDGKAPFAAMGRCWPGGVPGMMLFTAQATYYIQEPKEITIVHQRGTNIRHIYLNQEHPKTKLPVLSWYGDSVGHYEDGDIVIDTVDISTKAFVDNYGTPHTEQMHTVERYHMNEDKTLTGKVWVDDPGAFTMKWGASMKYNLHREPVSESEQICAENNDANYFSEDQVPIPQSKRPDF